MSSYGHLETSSNHYHPRRTADNKASVLCARAKHVPTTLTFSNSVLVLRTGSYDPVSYAIHLNYSRNSLTIFHQYYEDSIVQMSNAKFFGGIIVGLSLVNIIL